MFYWNRSSVWGSSFCLIKLVIMDSFFKKLDLESKEFIKKKRSSKMKYLYDIGFSYDEVNLIIFNRLKRILWVGIVDRDLKEIIKYIEEHDSI